MCRERAVIYAGWDYLRPVNNEVKMTYLLGIDTGGTYTDAVILREESEVIASAKSLTTREDLALGIGCAVQSVLSASAIPAAQISMAS